MYFLASPGKSYQTGLQTWGKVDRAVQLVPGAGRDLVVNCLKRLMTERKFRQCEECLWHHGEQCEWSEQTIHYASSLSLLRRPFLTAEHNMDALITHNEMKSLKQMVLNHHHVHVCEPLCFTPVLKWKHSFRINSSNGSCSFSPQMSPVILNKWMKWLKSSCHSNICVRERLLLFKEQSH